MAVSVGTPRHDRVPGRRSARALEDAMRAGPIPDSYWVEDGKLLAGEYPGSRREAAAREKLETIRAVGADVFLDLTEPGEHGLEPYDAYISGLEYRRMPIVDVSCPTEAQ